MLPVLSLPVSHTALPNVAASPAQVPPAPSLIAENLIYHAVGAASTVLPVKNLVSGAGPVDAHSKKTPLSRSTQRASSEEDDQPQATPIASSSALSIAVLSAQVPSVSTVKWRDEHGYGLYHSALDTSWLLGGGAVAYHASLARSALRQAEATTPAPRQL